MRLPLLLAFLAAEAFGQEVMVPEVSGHPFWADEVITYTPSADLINVPRSETMRVYRDSAGRIRTDASLNPPDPRCCPRFISDPVAGFIYWINSEKKFAQRIFYAPGQGQTLPTTDSSWKIPLVLRMDFFPEPSTKTEFLGNQYIGGFMAEGWRITYVYAAATLDGRTRPAQESVEENWYSQELQMMVLKQEHATFRATSTTRLENIDRSEPEPLLFQVPSDYTIVDEPNSQTAKPK